MSPRSYAVRARPVTARRARPAGPLARTCPARAARPGGGAGTGTRLIPQEWVHERQRTRTLADPHIAFDPSEGRRDIVVLGSTGSIGTQAVDLVLRNPDRFRVTALSAAGGRAGLLAEQAHRLKVRTVAVAREDAVPALREALAQAYGTEPQPEILAGPDAAAQLAASECHTVLNGITGSIGLAPTLAALEAGRTLALANKESLIVGGPLVKAIAKPGQIIPVDSEHAALFQALASGTRADVRKLVVTASGGLPRRTKAELAHVTREDALAHPTWAMGPVITVNSATLVNKGLEVIEAHLLYDIPFDRIEVVVHPQSYVHSMVEFTDGSTLAQATARHARPHRHRPRLARTRPGRGTRLRLDQGVHLGVLPCSTTTPSRRSASRGTSASSAGPRRPCSTPRTRSASTPSSPGGCRSTPSSRPSPRSSPSTAHPGQGTSLTVTDVLEAEDWARARARGLAAEAAKTTVQTAAEVRA